MSASHPLWPDYAPQHQSPSTIAAAAAAQADGSADPTASTSLSTATSRPSSASTHPSGTLSSASTLSPSSSSSCSPSQRRMAANLESTTHTSTSSRVLAQHHSTLALSSPSSEQRPVHTSSGRSGLQVSPAPSSSRAAPSASAHDAAPLGSASAHPPGASSPSHDSQNASAWQQQQQQSESRTEGGKHALRPSPLAAAIHPIKRLPSSSSATATTSLSPSPSPSSSSSSSLVAHGTSSRETDATARNNPIQSTQHRPQLLHQHTQDAHSSSYTQAQQPSSSSISSASSRSFLPSFSYGHSHDASTSLPTTDAQTTSSSNAPTSRTRSPPRSSQTEMRHNIAAFDPSLPPSSFAARRDASFARLRSGSGSIHGSSRAAAAGDAEVSIKVHIWWPSTSKNASSTLARAPLFRDAVNVKQKLTMRTSSSHGRTSENTHEAIFDRASFGFRHGAHSWLREKPSKVRLNTPSSSIGPLGQWKRAILLFRENGSLSIFGEGNALTHTLYCGALSSSDVRSVDDSLFGAPHVLSIRPRQPRVMKEVSITTRKQEAALQSERERSSEPIFVQFNGHEQLQYLRALLHVYTVPEIYGSPATVDTGGSHRFFRQLEITISDAKSIMPRWPAELADSGPELMPTTPSTSSTNPTLTHAHLPTSPTSSAVTAGGTSTTSGTSGTSGEPPRSLSHQLSSLRLDEHDDSPASEPLTEDAMSGSSRAGSRPGSRPSSRLHHASKPSLGSIRAHQDQENVASSFSRPASRAASFHDDQSQAGDEASCNDEPVSGPVSGQSGAHRFAANSANEAAASSFMPSSFGMPSRAFAQQRRDDKDRYEKARFDRFCRIRLDGELVARTSLSQANNSAFAVDKFKLEDVGDAKSLIIEVLLPTQKSNTSLTGSPSLTTSKYVMLGIVEIPIETLRRNEEIDGRFPIWSISTFPSTPAEEDDGRPPTSFHRGVVGELSVSIRLQEGAVMPLTMYDEVYRRIHDDTDSIDVFRQLASTMREDLLVSHITRICAASGTMAQRISQFIDLESATWGEKLEPELLFRANTLLSRSVDHYQRLLTSSWLDECLGPTVRKICHDPLMPSRPDTATSSGSAGTAGGDDGHFDFSTSMRSPPSLPANAIDSIPDGPMTINALRKLSESLWQNIYRQRHSCPRDLRFVLHKIRTRVNERYSSTKSSRPGIQGVGAFVFLRLFCAALNSPQLYGLTSCQPSRNASRKLLLLSKILLALASKKTAFDKEKDWELVPLNDLLRTYSSAYDDYITVISTEPPTAAPRQWLGTRIEGDADLQAAALRRFGLLSQLHRESIPRAPYMLDQPQALATFVSFVADAAQEPQQLDLSAASNRSEGEGSNAARIKQKAHEFVQICCQIDEEAGMCIEKAGYDPRPIPWERLQRAAMVQRNGDIARSSEFGSFAARGGQSYASVASRTSSTTSFSTAKMDSDAGDGSGASPDRMRSRRATVSTAHARMRTGDLAKGHDGSFDRTDADLEAASPQSSRRKSLGFGIRSGRRSSQIGAETQSPVTSYDNVGMGRRSSGVGGDIHTIRAKQANVEGGTRLPHRPILAGAQGEEDEHGSDDELRQAYRMLRAEEEASAHATSRVTTSSGIAAADIAKAREQTLSPVQGDAKESGLGLQTAGGLLEADDGSTFVHVYPLRTMVSDFEPGSRTSLGARQSSELARPSAMQPVANTLGATASQTVQGTTRVAAAVPNAATSLASRKLGARASFNGAPIKQHAGLRLASELTDESEANRRHSSDHGTAAAAAAAAAAGMTSRNYSLPRAGDDRRTGGGLHHEQQHQQHQQQQVRESADGFERAMEDAYAQTRASLPPSASMPVFGGHSSSLSSGVSVAARYGNETNHSTDVGAAKKKKWWKP